MTNQQPNFEVSSLGEMKDPVKVYIFAQNAKGSSEPFILEESFRRLKQSKHTVEGKSYNWNFRDMCVTESESFVELGKFYSWSCLIDYLFMWKFNRITFPSLGTSNSSAFASLMHMDPRKKVSIIVQNIKSQNCDASRAKTYCQIEFPSWLSS